MVPASASRAVPSHQRQRDGGLAARRAQHVEDHRIDAAPHQEVDHGPAARPVVLDGRGPQGLQGLRRDVDAQARAGFEPAQPVGADAAGVELLRPALGARLRGGLEAPLGRGAVLLEALQA